MRNCFLTQTLSIYLKMSDMQCTISRLDLVKCTDKKQIAEIKMVDCWLLTLCNIKATDTFKESIAKAS